MKPSLLGLLATAVLHMGSAVAVSAPIAGDKPARLGDGRTVFLTCQGKGSPTVILDAGWSSSHKAWRSVMPSIALETRVCAYDRPGTGRSDPGPLPRDGRAIARDLGQALHASGIGGPYVLVGHSIGALYARAFANQEPRNVVGMVLIDGTVENLQRRFEAVLGPGAGSVVPIILGARECLAAAEALPTGPALSKKCALPPPAVARWQNRISELETLFGATSNQLASGRRSYSDMPLITLTAANTYRGRPEQLWFDLHKEVARRSSRGEARLVPASGHNIAHDQPQAVVRAVTDVIVMARHRKAIASIRGIPRIG